MIDKKALLAATIETLKWLVGIVISVALISTVLYVGFIVIHNSLGGIEALLTTLTTAILMLVFYDTYIKHKKE